MGIKIEIELPNWIGNANLHILAGVEEVARKLSKESWKVKISRCKKCGKCCSNIPDNWSHGKDMETNSCKNLGIEAGEYFCKLKANRPFMCCVGDGREGECQIIWKEL